MKAFLLAAGLGSRLRPITNEIPKCLVPINGKPLLDYWFRLFQKYGIDEILINLHYLPDKVLTFLESVSYPFEIKAVYEEQLLGSAGTVLTNKAWVENEDDFFVIYADNLSNVNLNQILSFHLKHKPVFTMGLFQTTRPEECGIATIDREQTIIGFEEKPESPRSNLANAGIYLVRSNLFDFLPQRIPLDFGFDVFPRLIGKMKGFLIRDYLLDIGTLENYRRAQRDIQQINFPGGDK